MCGSPSRFWQRSFFSHIHSWLSIPAVGVPEVPLEALRAVARTAVPLAEAAIPAVAEGTLPVEVTTRREVAGQVVLRRTDRVSMGPRARVRRLRVLTSEPFSHSRPGRIIH